MIRVLFTYCLVLFAWAAAVAQEQSHGIYKQCMFDDREVRLPAVLPAIQQRNPVRLNLVVHILYSDASQNISTEQVLKQVEQLNADYSLNNANFNQTPEVFKIFAIDTDIQFCLAKTDPNGNPTTGITRKQVDIDQIGLTNAYYDSAQGGQSPWDATRYINVWVADMGDTGIIGFSTAPNTASPKEKDGILINYRFFGEQGAHQDAAHNLGKSLSHEMGHFFGLKHTWGSLNAGCDDDDDCLDTPLQEKPTYGCPSFPVKDICTQGNGIMYCNFMDYSDDSCLTMFTADQKAIMWGHLEGERASLRDHADLGCYTSTVDLDIALKIYPNPTQDYIELIRSDVSEQSLQIFNTDGFCVYSKQVVTSDILIDLTSYSAGVYFLKLGEYLRKIIVL